MAEQAAEKSPAKPFKPRKESGAASVRAFVNLLDSIFTLFGEVALLTGSMIRSIMRYGVNLGDLVKQMAAIGADSIWIVCIIAMATGSVFALYTAKLSLTVGVVDFVGGTLGYAYLNELGPVLGGVAFAARSGAAVAAEIGSMVVTEQVDALKAMAISPVRYLVVPRVLAAIIMLPILTAIGDVVGLFSGFISSELNGIPPSAFLNSLYRYTRPLDLTRGLIKATAFGYIVGIIACQQGLRTKGGATGVGRSTTTSVVLCVMLISIADLIIAVMLQQTTGR
jgi:phospholipid/cholesterol/gamma-HCH transport system permease protein